MSTQATTTDLAVKPEMLTYGLIVRTIPDGTNADGSPKHKVTLRAVSRESEITEAEKEAADPNSGVQFQKQSFSYDKAGTIEGILQIIKDPEEAIAIFNAGLKVRFNSKVVASLTATDDNGEPDFQFQEGSIDMRTALNEPSQKRNLSPLDKSIKTLQAVPGVTPEKLAQIMALLQQS